MMQLRPPTAAAIEVHTLSAAERRMLLEMLASERSGEECLRVGDHPVRDSIADSLCALQLSRWVSRREVVFTYYGRHIAEALAHRIVQRELALAC